jgi:Icc-related predicted phosphoesterase
MKILAIGDPHGDLKKINKIPIKDVDLILLTGDLGKADLARKRFFENVKREKKGLPPLNTTKKDEKAMEREIEVSTIQLLKYLSKKAPVYTLLGNVGVPNRRKVDKMKNINIVKNQLRVLKGVRIGFLEYFLDTSWVKEFKPKGYKNRMKTAKKETEKARKILKRFGKDLDILLTHVPPYGVLDMVDFPGIPKDWKGKHAGSKAILDYIKKYHPRFVVCGHIHEGLGQKKVGETEVYNLGVAEAGIIEVDN